MPSAYTTILQQFYLAYFGRPADPVGLNTSAAALAAAGAPTTLAGLLSSTNATVVALINGFGSSAESNALFTGGTTARVTAIYQNVLNRNPDVGGLLYWSQEIDSGRLSLARVALAVIEAGARDVNDGPLVTAKTNVAISYTASLDTVAEINAYNGTAAAASARTLLSTVTAATTTAAFQASVDSNIATLVSTGGGAAAGVSSVLTTGVDILVGTSGNDTFSSADTTLTAADQINGGAGTDVLNYTNSAAGAALPAASITNVETLNLRHVGTGVVTLNASTIAGVTAVNTDRSTSEVTVTNLASGASAGIIGNGTVVTGAFKAGYVDAATAATLNVSGGANGGAVVLTGDGVLATTVNSTGAANTIGAVTAAASSTSLTINATSALTTGAVTAAGVVGTGLTVSGTGNVTTNLNAVAATRLNVTNTTGAVNTGVLNNATVTVDATANTGGVTTTLGTSTATVFTGGSGNDIVTAGAILGAGAAVNAGAGTADRIVFTANGQLTAASGAKYTNFEVLQSTGATDINLSNITGITALRTSGDATFTNVTATQAGAITTVASGNLNIGVAGAATVGQLDTVSITTSSTNVDVAIATLAAAGVETINLTAATGTGVTSITNFAHADWATLNLSGASAITIATTATAATINTAVNASTATGVVTFDASLSTTNGLAITGGSANDVLTGSAQADVVSGGVGNDTIVGNAGNDTLNGGDGNDSITGGTGADTINVGVGTDTVLLTATGQTFGGAIVSGTTVLTGIDRVTGLGAGDIVNLVALSNTFTGAAGTTIAAATGTTVSLVRGNFVDATAIFTADAAGTATLVVYDNNAVGADTLEAVLLVGVAGLTGTVAAGVLTLA